MVRQLNRLSVAKVRSITEPGLYHDGGGLYLQVSKRGSKSWLYIYTVNKKRREMGLGSASAVTLAEARSLLADNKKLLAQKVDPVAVRKSDEAKARFAAASNMTFQQCAEAYIQAHEPGWQNKKHIHQWKATLASYVYPIIGKLSVQDIDVALVMKVIEPIWSQKTETADRIRGRVEKILDWAAVREYRAGENPARWRGKLENLLPRRTKLQKVVHYPALAYTQIGTFMSVLAEQPGLDARALEFTILTATRTGESIGAKWEEIDIPNKVWVIPADRMKAGKEHRVPLSGKTIAVLKHAAELVSDKKHPDINQLSGWVFPGRSKTKSFSNMAMLALLKRLKRRDITVHGFRSTFRDWAAEQTAFPREVAEAALAHTLGDKVEAAYRRGDLFQKRCKLMEQWAKYCATIPSAKSDTNVVSIGKATKA